ncbi:hypothetical protein CASFOL_021985 [Castilleja foliolosa]|uniref:Bifunctional inhibitor/plant lipid transfer protein/seed storage helical domain-containing protein n=1 Tax=Castilleja foliolosa TaxID=1961234 RepID=A0ABD3D1M9_9LAMI
MAITHQTHYVVFMSIMMIGAMKTECASGQHPNPPPIAQQPRRSGTMAVLRSCFSNMHTLHSEHHNLHLHPRGGGKKDRKPSEICCSIVRETDMALFCKRLVNNLFISATRVVYVVKYCHRSKPPYSGMCRNKPFQRNNGMMNSTNATPPY